jgi:hypothetical protein
MLVVEEEMNMSKKMIGLLSCLVFLIGMVLISEAQQDQSGVRESGTGTVNPTTSTNAGKTSQSIITAAEDYLQQKLGEMYYKKWIVRESAESYNDCEQTTCAQRNEILFSYNIPFSTEGADPHFSLQPDKIQITLDENGVIQRYSGPKKPYQFLVDENQARIKAKNYGLQQITESVLSTSALTTEGYELVWAVSSNDEIARGSVMNEPIYQGVYIDVDSGEIRGEFRINPLIEVPGGSAGGVELGNFFTEEDTTQDQKKQPIKQKRSSILLIILIGAILASLIIFGLVWRKQRKL